MNLNRREDKSIELKEGARSVVAPSTLPATTQTKDNMNPSPDRTAGTLLCPDCGAEVTPFITCNRHLKLSALGSSIKEPCFQCTKGCQDILLESQCIDPKARERDRWWDK